MINDTAEQRLLRILVEHAEEMENACRDDRDKQGAAMCSYFAEWAKLRLRLLAAPQPVKVEPAPAALTTPLAETVHVEDCTVTVLLWEADKGSGDTWALTFPTPAQTRGVAAVLRKALLPAPQPVKVEPAPGATVSGPPNVGQPVDIQTAPHEWTRDAVLSVKADADGAVWLRTLGGYVCRADWEGRSWRRVASAASRAAKTETKVEPAPVAWNWCHHCRQLVDADDIRDGSEVRCLGCRRTFVCVACTDGSWVLDEVQPEPTPAVYGGVTPCDRCRRVHHVDAACEVRDPAPVVTNGPHLLVARQLWDQLREECAALRDQHGCSPTT
jgi:hypothetical protein